MSETTGYPDVQRPGVQRAVEAAVHAAENGSVQEARHVVRNTLDVHGEAAVLPLHRGAVRLAFGARRWHEGIAILQELAPAHPRSKRMLRRARWCAAQAEPFQRYFATPGHTDRILAAVSGRYPAAVSVRSDPVAQGANSMANYRHRLFDETGHLTGQIFEKVYIGTHPTNLRRVRALHERLGPAPRRTPEFYGEVRIGPFVSSLHRFVAGGPPKPAEWPQVQRSLVLDLWMQQSPPPSGRVPAVAATAKLLSHQVLGVGTLANTTWHWPARRAADGVAMLAQWSPLHHLRPHLPPDTIAELAAAYPEIDRRLRRMPRFVMHQDMHRNQAIYDPETKQYLLIDWDRWSLEPVGAGWPLDEGTVRPDPPPLRDGWRIDAHGTPWETDALMLPAVLWEMRKSHAAGRSERIGQLARILFDHLSSVSHAPSTGGRE